MTLVKQNTPTTTNTKNVSNVERDKIEVNNVLSL